jgi:hypothetical protein
MSVYGCLQMLDGLVSTHSSQLFYNINFYKFGNRETFLSSNIFSEHERKNVPKLASCYFKNIRKITFEKIFVNTQPSFYCRYRPINVTNLDQKKKFY